MAPARKGGSQPTEIRDLEKPRGTASNKFVKGSDEFR